MYDVTVLGYDGMPDVWRVQRHYVSPDERPASNHSWSHRSHACLRNHHLRILTVDDDLDDLDNLEL